MASDKHINLESMLPTGSILHGNYRIDGYLSSGGFGNTYVATHILFNETYAIKEFFMKDISERGSDSSSVRVSNAGKTEEFNAQLEKFRKEALRLRKLHNVHIVRVYDLFNENGTAYYVMDFINGENLKERLQRTGQPMAESEIRKVLDQVLDALQEVHGQGLWHMDLKPANVMVDKSGVVKLIDFGASKQFNSDTGGAISTSAVAYTNGYAPREQMERSYDKFGPWTDFYALGAMLYNLLTLKHPPMPGDIDDDTSPDKHEALPMPAKVSPLMRGLVLWLIKTNRKQRPQNVQQIKEFLNPPTPNQTPPPVIDFDQKALVLNVMGKGTIMVFLDGRPIQVPCKLQPQMREMTYHVTATAQANGAVRSEEVGMMIVVPALKQTAAPTISFDPKSFTLNASGKGTVKVYLDDREIEVPCTFPQQMREQSFNVTATAQVDGEVKSDEAHLRVVVPALRQTAAPSINYDAKAFTLNVTGKGAVQVLLDGKNIQVPYTFKQQREEQSFNVTATAQVDGELMSEEARLRVVVPALRQTAVPVINYDAKTFTLNVTGKGAVQVLLDGKKIQVPYTFKRQKRAMTYQVTATAQDKDELRSETATLQVSVPAAVVVLPATDETQVKTESQAATKLQPEPTNEPVTVVKPEPVKVVHEYETDSQTESKPRKLWPVILAACAGLLLVVGGYALLHNSDPTPTQSDEEVNKEAVEAAAEEVAEQSKVVVENKQVVIPLCADGTSCTYSGPVNADGMPDGEGSVQFENGDRLEGYFTNGNADGTCTYTFKSGDKFEGTMMNNEFEKGKYTLPDGSYFEGSFKDYRPAVGTWYNKTGKVIKKI